MSTPDQIARDEHLMGPRWIWCLASNLREAAYHEADRAYAIEVAPKHRGERYYCGRCSSEHRYTPSDWRCTRLVAHPEDGLP